MNDFATALDRFTREGRLPDGTLSGEQRALLLGLERARTQGWDHGEDDADLAPLVARHRSSEHVHERLVARSVERWMNVRVHTREEPLEALEHEARSLEHASLVAEAATLRAVHAALHLSAGGDASKVLQTVRRASRLTRTEAMPALELHANLALARVRRLAGSPHLSARILASLAARAAPNEWLAWECLWAGIPAHAERMEAPYLRLVRSAQEALHESDWTSFRTSVDAFSDLPPPFDADLRRFREAFDIAFETDSDFRRGRGALAPAMRGLAALRDGRVFRAHVLVQPGTKPCRLLSGGLALVGARFARVEAEGRRTLSALAVLASEPEWNEAAFFRELYRFEFVEEKHRAVLNVLLHRMKNALGAHATLERGNGRLALRCHEPFAFGDPRCDADGSERLLALIAEGRESARSLAERAGLPLRSVQDILKQLVDEGACVRTRRGRAIEYVLEDTTFREPTRH